VAAAIPETQPEPAVDLLSDREHDVVALIASGCANRDIAEQLGIAVGTVERHVANILKKLGFRSRSQVAKWAIEQGLASVPADPHIDDPRLLADD
jgi:DNA-binding NarL/FixJ family response regulator